MFKNRFHKKDEITKPQAADQNRTGLMLGTRSSVYQIEPVNRENDVWRMNGGSGRMHFDNILIENPYTTLARRGDPLIIGEGQQLWFKILDVKENPEEYRGRTGHTSEIQSVRSYEPSWLLREQQAELLAPESRAADHEDSYSPYP